VLRLALSRTEGSLELPLREHPHPSRTPTGKGDIAGKFNLTLVNVGTTKAFANRAQSHSEFRQQHVLNRL
jgi:hypothetical protein